MIVEIKNDKNPIFSKRFHVKRYNPADFSHDE